MIKFVIRRILLMIPILLGISLLVQIVIDITPGDPARIMAGSSGTEEDYLKIRADLRLDDPFFARYFRYIGGVFHGDLGSSYASHKTVWSDIMARFPYTLILVFCSLILSLLIGIPIGIYAATHQYTWKDNAAILGSLFCVSMPSFWFALLIVQLFAVRLRFLPVAGADTWKGWILPVISLALGFIATITRQLRSDMLEVIRQDYIITARAKGLSERRVLYRHALKNALIPVIMIVGTVFGLSLGGAMITETIFSLPGLGTYTIAALSGRDYPVIQGSVLFLSTLFSFIILFVDIIFAFVDPRIRSQYTRSKKPVGGV